MSKYKSKKGTPEYYWEISQERLKGVNPLLRSAILDAYNSGKSPFGIYVTEGYRTPEAQRNAFLRGNSNVQKGNHQTGNAVDIYPVLPDGTISYNQDHFHQFYEFLRPYMEKRLGTFDPEFDQITGLDKTTGSDTGFGYGGVWGNLRGGRKRVKAGYGVDAPHWEVLGRNAREYTYDPTKPDDFVYTPLGESPNIQQQQAQMQVQDATKSTLNYLSNANPLINTLVTGVKNLGNQLQDIDWNSMHKPVATSISNPKRIPQYDLHQVALDTIKGKYGNGQARKQKFNELGINYADVQSLVNNLYRG